MNLENLKVLLEELSVEEMLETNGGQVQLSPFIWGLPSTPNDGWGASGGRPIGC